MDNPFNLNLTGFSGQPNLSDFTMDQTLSNSELSYINLNNTSEFDLNQTFCREAARVMSKFYEGINNGRSQTNIHLAIIWVLFFLFIVIVIVIIVIYKCKNDRKHKNRVHINPIAAKMQSEVCSTDYGLHFGGTTFRKLLDECDCYSTK